MVKTIPVKSFEDVLAHTITHGETGVYINNRNTKEIRQYSENMDLIKTVSLGLCIRDIALTPADDIIGSDCENKRLVRISRSDDITTLCSTGELRPLGLCINDKQQIVVGLRAGLDKPPIKLVVYTTDGSDVVFEIEKDKSGKPLFTESIYQVKQNANGDYVVADGHRIVCVDRVGEFRWEHQVKQGKWTPLLYMVWSVIGTATSS